MKRTNSTTTVNLPIISNPYGIPCFEDFIAEAYRQFDEEKKLKNAAFAFLTSKGLYNEFHAFLHNTDSSKDNSLTNRVITALNYVNQNIAQENESE